MERYPLFFKFKDVVYGKGFLAQVVAIGRTLLVREEDEWWLYGVQPGGMAERGKDQSLTLRHFRATYRNVLLDIASDSEDFENFCKTADSFFKEIDEEDEREWNEARQKIKSGKMDVTEKAWPLAREKGNIESTIEITLLEADARFAIGDNDKQKLREGPILADTDFARAA